MSNSTHELANGNINRLLIKFSLPAIVGMIVNATYNVVDRVFIGHGIGSLGLAGITVGFPFMLLSMAFGMMIGLGAATLISIKLGEGKKEEAEYIAGQAMILLIVVSVLFTIAGLLFLNPLLALFGASPDVMPYAVDYMQIILLGTISQGLGFGANNMIRAEGNPRTAMLTMLIGALLNAILAPLFIFVFKWGMQGAAIATVAAQSVSAIWVLFYFFKGNKSYLHINSGSLKFNLQIAKRICTIGMAPFLMQSIASVVIALFNISIIRYGGDTAVSAMGIINSINMLVMMPVFGINQGAQPIIGYNFGAEKYDRVKSALFLAVVYASIVVFVGFILCMVFPVQLISLFNSKDYQLIEIGSHSLRIFTACLPIVGAQIAIVGYFQAIGKPKHALLLSLSRQLIILLPALYILPRFFGLEGVIAAGPVSDFLSSILAIGMLVFELKHLDRKHYDTVIER